MDELSTHLNNHEVKKWVDVLVAAPLHQAFTYRWLLTAEPKVGQRLIVPWGKNHRVGLVARVVLQVDPAIEAQIKPVYAVLDDGVLLNANWWALVKFASMYYHAALGVVAMEGLPTALKTLGRDLTETPMARKALVKIQNQKAAWADDRFANSDAALSETPLPNNNLAPTLNVEQSNAAAYIAEQVGFKPMVLFGVTGSGKTEVYLQAIRKAIARNQQVLVLVPEINLTPAALEVYSNRLQPHQVVVLHSGLAEGERTQNWLQVAAGLASVVIATRLGVWVPLPKLGLMVVDEEHDPSYRQQDGFRYHARDLAVMMAKIHEVPVVLGSATPSLETWQKTIQGVWPVLHLKQRAVSTAQLPDIRVVDTRRIVLHQGLSDEAIQAIDQNIKAGLQTLVFLNRRGYAPQLACYACGWMANCKHCSAHVVWHKREGLLRCHHCGAVQRLPKHCPSCGNQDLKPIGHGTQKLEEALQERWPDAKIVRMDADSTRKQGSMQRMLHEAKFGDVDVLVGTQMLAKGHDFNRISLVVAINADASLYAHAYRAPERLFAQLMQVAGRAGRHGGSAKMMVHTQYPHHPIFTALKAHDYVQFAQSELQARQSARMPPFGFQALVRAEAKEIARALDFLQDAKHLATQLCGNVELGFGLVEFGDPVPLNIVRVANVERAQLLVECESRPVLQRFLEHWLKLLPQNRKGVKWMLEIDPLEL